MVTEQHTYQNSSHIHVFFIYMEGWSGGAMVLGKLPVPGRPTILITVGQGSTVLAVGAGCLDIFTLLYPFSPLSPSWETTRYRLKYCLKGPLNPTQLTNQSFIWNKKIVIINHASSHIYSYQGFNHNYMKKQVSWGSYMPPACAQCYPLMKSNIT